MDECERALMVAQFNAVAQGRDMGPVTAAVRDVRVYLEAASSYAARGQRMNAMVYHRLANESLIKLGEYCTIGDYACSQELLEATVTRMGEFEKRYGFGNTGDAA